MASANSLDSKPAASKQAESVDGVGRVLRAARLKPTVGAQVGAYQFLVGLDGNDANAGWDPGQSRQGLFQTRPRSDPLLPASKGFAPSEIHATRVENGTSGTVDPAITTKSYPSGRPAARMASRSLRFARLRTTALPIRRPVTRPNRTFPGCPTALTITKSPDRRRRPVVRTVRKLAEERSETGLSGETLTAFCTP
jgi:hypothetical protein